MTGNRKLRVFYVTLSAILVVFVSGLALGVQLTGDNVVTLITVIAVLGGSFMGANFGEHWAKAKNGTHSGAG